MLKQVRTALKGVLAWFVIVLLVLAFALWGVPELRSFTQRSPLRVGDASFSTSAISSEFNRQMNTRRSESAGKYTREQAMAEGLPDQVVSIMATRSVLEQEAEKMGLVMPRSLIRDYLKNDEQFRNPVTGEFDGTILQSILAYNQWTARQFESLLRADRLRSQLVASISAGATAPRPLVYGLLLRRIELRRVAYLTVTDDMAGPPEEPTPDALTAYYEENKSGFMAPEYRTFTAVLLRSSQFRDGLEAPEEALRKVYDASKARLYEVPERRTLYQVTFDAEAQAQAAVSALRQGTPFENIAEQKGLNLKSVTFTEIQKSDILDPSVSDAAFAAGLGAGEVVGPVKGLFGWAVVQVVAVIAPETKEFEEVRDEIAAQYTDQDARKRLFEAVEALEEARDTGSALVAAAAAAGVTARQFGPVDSFSFEPGGAIIADLPGEILTQAFKLNEGDESEAVELASDDGYFFVQVDAETPPALRPYDEVRDQIERRWRSEERDRRIAAAIKQVTDAIAAGSTFEEAAAPLNRAVLVSDLNRNTTETAFSGALVAKIFQAEKNSVVVGPADSREAQTIAQIRDIGFNASLIGPGDETAFQQYLGYLLNQELLDAYVEALRKDYGVRADANALAQIFNEGQ